MSEDTQALPPLDTPEPTPPKPPTLASMIISEVQDIHEDIRIFNSNTITYWGGILASVVRLQTQVNALTAAVCVLVLTNISILALVAWLTGHVR